MAAAAILNFDQCATFRHDICVLYRIRNNSTQFGENQPNSKKMPTVFRNPRWRQPPSWILVNMLFWHDSCVFHQIRNITTKIGEDWYNSRKKWQPFFEIQDVHTIVIAFLLVVAVLPSILFHTTRCSFLRQVLTQRRDSSKLVCHVTSLTCSRQVTASDATQRNCFVELRWVAS